MSERLNQNDLDDLSAWLDGELTGGRAAEIERLLKVSPAWQEASRQIRAVDEAMDAYTAPPMPAGLADRIIAASVGSGAASWRTRIIRLAVPVAAAAAIALGAVVLYDAVAPGNQTPAQPPAIADRNPVKQPDEQFVVQNLDFFGDYQTVANLDVLRAMDGSTAIRKPPEHVTAVSPDNAVSIEKQLELKNKLLLASRGQSLAAATEQNRSQWQKLPSDRQDSCRQDAMAFLNTSPQRQQELLAGYDELISMDPQKRAELAAKAREVSAIIKTLSSAEFEAFKKAQPAEQAKIVEKQKDVLQKKGLLPENQ